MSHYVVGEKTDAQCFLFVFVCFDLLHLGFSLIVLQQLESIAELCGGNIYVLSVIYIQNYELTNSKIFVLQKNSF